jgi:hypothetical protein
MEHSMSRKSSKGFNASLYQIRIGYQYFRGEPMPGDLPFQKAGNDLVHDFGRDRVQKVLTAIAYHSGTTDADALAAAKAADEEQQ